MNKISYEKRMTYSVLLNTSLSDRARLIYVYLGVTPRRKWKTMTALCRDVGFDLGLSKNCIRKYIDELISAGIINAEDLLGNSGSLPRKPKKASQKTANIHSINGLRQVFDEWYQEKEDIQYDQFKKEYLSTTEMCQIFKVSKPTLWRWSKIGYLKPVKLGRLNFYKRSDIKELMATK